MSGLIERYWQTPGKADIVRAIGSNVVLEVQHDGVIFAAVLTQDPRRGDRIEGEWFTADELREIADRMDEVSS